MPSLSAGAAPFKAFAGTTTASTHWLINTLGLEDDSL
jgi:hypothetical protein